MGLSRALGSPNGAMRAPQLYVWKLHSEVTSWLVAEGRHTRQIHGVQQVFTPDLQKFPSVGTFGFGLKGVLQACTLPGLPQGHIETQVAIQDERCA